MKEKKLIIGIPSSYSSTNSPHSTLQPELSLTYKGYYFVPLLKTLYKFSITYRRTNTSLGSTMSRLIWPLPVSLASCQTNPPNCCPTHSLHISHSSCLSVFRSTMLLPDLTALHLLLSYLELFSPGSWLAAHCSSYRLSSNSAASGLP